MVVSALFAGHKSLAGVVIARRLAATASNHSAVASPGRKTSTKESRTTRLPTTADSQLRGVTTMLTKTKIALATALLAATSSVVMAQGFAPNTANRYPTYDAPQSYGYVAGTNSPT